MSLRSRFARFFQAGPSKGSDQTSAPAEQESAQQAIGQKHGVYLPDAAVQNPADDKFDRKPFADRIAETLGGRVDPSSIVVGVYGPWGDGKSTVLNFVEKALAKFEGVVCVKFNPW